jgi:VanZ family protein
MFPNIGAGYRRILFAFCLVVVLVLALVPPSVPTPATGWDKANHALAFAVLAWLGRWSFPGRTGALLGGLLAYGVLIELLQALTPYRDADWHDVVADGVGLVRAWAVGRLMAAPAGDQASSDSST